MGAEGVYRIDLDGKVTRILSQPAIERPNGLAVTPDARTLYLVDSDAQVMIKGVQKPTVLITGAVPKGWEVSFDPQTRRVQATGHGEGVKLRTVDPSHTHELRFDPEPKS